MEVAPGSREWFAQIGRDPDKRFAAKALRALQQADEAIDRLTDSRPALNVVLDALGERLGLECNGDREEGGWVSHDGDTCPIHEWLVESDFAEVELARAKAREVDSHPL